MVPTAILTMHVELHCHSNFSFLDGASHPHDLVAGAKELGMSALALTDHDGLYGVVKFCNAAKEQGIKPLIGAEITMDGGYHLTLLVRDSAGYSNLCRLISQAQIRHGKGRASLDKATLERHSEGLFCLSGCKKGEIPQLTLGNKREEALRATRQYLDIFGRNFYIELQNNLCPEDRRLCRGLVELATYLGVSCVATNNVHYARREGHRLQDILVCIRNRTTLDSSHHLRRPNSEYYIKSSAEMARLFQQYPEALANTLQVAEACSFDLGLSRYRFPDFSVPQGETADSYLEKLCWQKVYEKYRTVAGEVELRLKEELRLIRKLGLAGYFLTVWDIMRHAKENGIPAQGRGSAASSIVTYILGVTRVDPVKHKLFAGRFLNDEMSAIPDIDIDIASDNEDHREKLIQYIYQRYGQGHAAMLCNVVTYQARNTVRDIGKAMGLPPETIDRMARSLETRSAENLEEDLCRLNELRHQLKSTPWEQFLEMSQQIAGFPRHLGIHVGGMIVSTTPLSDIVPLERATKPGRVVTQWDKDDISDAGLIKIDLLGLRMLSLIHEVVNLVRENRGMDLDTDNIPLDDPRVYDMLCRGDTLGVFQVESRAQQAILPQSRPRCFEDLIAEVAIIRPGPIQGNAVHPYLRRRQGKEKVSYLHPRLKPILRETLGVIIYQEQVIQTAMAIAGFTPGQADSLRRAMSRKRSREAMERLRQDFLEGSQRNGIEGSVAAAAFQQIASFAEFGFCKAHAAALAETTYRSAWLKLHYPCEYCCALLNCQPMGFYSPEVIVNHARQEGIGVLPVDINLSQARCTVEGGEIRLGFRYVKGVGEKTWQKMQEERKKRPYTSLADFYTRARTERDALANLILAGAFDFLGLPRRQLLWELGKLIWRPAEALPLGLPDCEVQLPAMTLADEVANDYEVQGLSARHHPMEVFRPGLSVAGVVTSSGMADMPSGAKVQVAGCVVCRQAPGTAKGHVFITLEDEYGLVNVILRPSVYERYRQIARLEPLVIVEGALQKNDGVINILAERLSSLREGSVQGEEMRFLALRARNFA